MLKSRDGPKSGEMLAAFILEAGREGLICLFQLLSAPVVLAPSGLSLATVPVVYIFAPDPIGKRLTHM
jgi:hypothetical protein